MNYAEIIYSTAIADGVGEALAKLIVAQARHETGNFTSNIFLKNNNAFGYSEVKGAKWQVPGSSIIADNHVPAAKYAKLEDSVHEITGWLKRRWNVFKDIQLPAEYAVALKKEGYYGDTLINYTAGLNKWFRDGQFTA